MKRIYKYALDLTDRQTVNMPGAAKLLTVQMQNGVPCLWALVEPVEPDAPRMIQIFGTGHDASDAGTYIATFQTGPLVFHVFEGKPQALPEDGPRKQQV